MLTEFLRCQKAREISHPYYISIASSVQAEKASKNTLEPPAQREKIGTEKLEAQADAVVEEVDFFVWTCRFQ